MSEVSFEGRAKVVAIPSVTQAIPHCEFLEYQLGNHKNQNKFLLVIKKNS